MKNADMPAMPLPLGNETTEGHQGLTKREELAMRLFSVNAESLTDSFRPQHYQPAARVCIELADALLKELER